MAEADVVVVGAGIAGLTAARDLAAGGLSVLVLESADAVGGKVSSHTVAGIELDAGAESFATRDGTVRALLTEIGLEADVVAPASAGAWVQQADGGAHPLPRTGILGIPGVPMARDVLQVIGFAGALRAQLDSLIPGSVGSRESRLGPLVRRRMGRAVLDRLVAPVTMGVHSKHPDELDVDRVAPGLKRELRRHDSLARAVLALREAAPAGASIGGLRGGIHRLASELHREVLSLGGEVRLGTTVLTTDADGVTLAGGERIPAALGVFAPAVSPDGTSIVLATLVVDSVELDAAPRGTGVLVERGSAIGAKAITHSTAKWPWLAETVGSGRHVLRLSYEASRVSRDGLAEQARADAAALLGVRLPAASVQAFARVEWHSAPATGHAVPSGVVPIGEATAGTGLAAVISQTRQASAAFLSELAESSSGRGDDGDHDDQPDRH